MSKRAFATALFLAGTALISSSFAQGQLGNPRQRLDGTWLLTGKLGPITLKGITTYLPDGTMFGANSNTFQGLQGGPAETQLFFNPGQGQWVQTGDHEFAGFLVGLTFNNKGQGIGIGRVRFKVQYNDALDFASGSAFIENLDLDGNVIGPTLNPTIELKRLSVDMF
jgi:hypothetical protein